MAVSLVGFGTFVIQGSSTNGIAFSPTNPPGMPAGTAAGDRVYVLVTAQTVAPSATAVVPEGWTPVAAEVGNPSALSPSVTAYYRDYDGSWTIPRVVMGLADDHSVFAVAATLRKGAGETWGNPVFTWGYDANTASPATFTGSSIPMPTGSGLLVLLGFNIGSDRLVTNHAVTGVTAGPWTKSGEDATGTGENISGSAAFAPVTAGATAAPTFTATQSGTAASTILLIDQPVLAGGTPAPTYDATQFLPFF